MHKPEAYLCAVEYRLVNHARGQGFYGRTACTLERHPVVGRDGARTLRGQGAPTVRERTDSAGEMFKLIYKNKINITVYCQNLSSTVTLTVQGFYLSWHNTPIICRFVTGFSRSRVRHSTAEPLRLFMSISVYETEFCQIK